MSEAREDAARRLWGLWQQGGRPDLAAFLAGADPLGPLDLAAVVRVDQRQRWLTGEHRPAEHYLRLYSILAADEEAALDLVYAEYLLRREQGEEVATDDFCGAFRSTPANSNYNSTSARPWQATVRRLPGMIRRTHRRRTLRPAPSTTPL